MRAILCSTFVANVIIKMIFLLNISKNNNILQKNVIVIVTFWPKCHYFYDIWYQMSLILLLWHFVLNFTTFDIKCLLYNFPPKLYYFNLWVKLSLLLHFLYQCKVLFTILQSFSCIACVSLLCYELSYSRVEKRRVTCFFKNLFNPLLCLSFRLAYLYIQCTDISWTAPSYNTDSRTQDQHPMPHWSG